MNLHKNSKLIFVGLILFTAFFLRLLLIFNFGFEADISFWKSWGLGVFDHGIVWAAHNTNNNYPTPFAYLLGFMVWVYSFFANPHNFNQFWSNGNYLFLFISKTPSILADFGIAGIIFWLGKNAKRLNLPPLSTSFYFLLSIFYLFNPISLIDGAWWGQVDSLGVVIFLLALIAALTKKPFLAGVIFMAAMLTKLQNMIYGPVFFLFLWQYLGFDGLLKAVAGAVLAFFGLNLEFFLARDMGRVVSSLTDNFDYFPLMSLNAYNLWWIAARGHGMAVSDKLLTIGLVNAKTLGLILFSGFYLFAVLRQLLVSSENNKYRQKLTQSFVESLIIVNAAFFLFQTQSHDRYAYPLSVFLLLWAPFIITGKKSGKLFFIFYAIFSAVYFYNLHTALIANYPANGLPWLSLLTQIPLTIAASAILIGLFAFFVMVIVRKNPPLVFLLPLVIFLTALASLNAPLLTKQPVSLTRLSPYTSTQGYGQTVTNMPVNASLGIKNWTPLSDQYFFYRKGIGTHANSLTRYDLGGHFKSFTTDYGIDTEAGGKGMAYFEIYGDGQKLFASDKIGRFDPPRHAEINVADIKTLDLVTKPAGNSIMDDHTDWLNPLLYP